MYEGFRKGSCDVIFSSDRAVDLRKQSPENRFYDPEVGRFITQDPAKQGLNWYSYCRNNPLRYTDPDGRICGADDAATLRGFRGVRNRRHGGSACRPQAGEGRDDGRIWLRRHPPDRRDVHHQLGVVAVTPLMLAIRIST